MTILPRVLMLLAFALPALSTPGEEVVLFKASTAGADVWSWGGARVEPAGGALVITEQNPSGDYGDAFVSDAFPFLPGATLNVQADAPSPGSFTLQVLGFQGSENLFTTNLIHHEAQPVHTRIALADRQIPEAVDSLLLKTWVADAEGASVRLNELTYAVTLPPGGPLYNERFESVAGWPADRIRAAPQANGARLELEAEASHGSILRTGHILKSDHDQLLFKIGPVRGRVTLQAAVFDTEGIYLKSVDLIKDVGEGWHGARVSRIAWPEGTAQYELKVWLTGGAGSTAVLERLLIYRL